MAQAVALKEGEGRGVAAQQVLPTEPQGPASGLSGQNHPVKGRQVVRFFVQVDDVGPKGANLAGQARVEMEVKMAVERHSLYDQFVALGVGPFQGKDAALVLPERGDHDAQFHPQAGNFL